MESILIVTSTEKSKGFLKELLASTTFTQLVTVYDGSEARRQLIDNAFDLVLINAPLKDEFGHDLALSLAESTTSGIILFVKTDLADQVSEKVEEFGVVVVPKPISKQLFFQSLKIVAATRKRLLDLQSENMRLQHRIEDMRLVDRAKCALIEHLDLTEPQAHRYIEKNAMDMRISRREVAEGILKNYKIL
ncbi:MAG: two-component system, response regulator PdtaR [Clostridiales bacterium]|jgi:response regulator NasT|nr:two-component system, response regulator PdtaR [Clostridiales bacterium]